MVDDTGVGTAGTASGGGAARTFLRAPVAADTWRALGYLLVCLPLGLVGIVYLFFGFGVGLLLSPTFLGIPLLAGVVVATRRWGAVHRAWARTMLRADVVDPAPFAGRRSVTGWLRDALGDRTGWRAVLFLLVKAPLSVLGGYGAVLLWVESWFTAVSPVIWVVAHPTNVDEHGVRHHSLLQLGSVYMDTWPRVLAVAGVGVVSLWLTPWPLRWFARLDTWLVAGLLGASPRDRRVEQLERTRATAVEDAAATLRRVERDLHDGTQARLVAVAMNLSRAREQLAADDAEGADALLASAHATAKDALSELRDVVRGIHPPALDMGLDAALATLAARTPVPVDLDVRLRERPSPAVETIAYFCTAELLTNVTRHAGAARAEVSAAQSGDRLVLQVRDDGHGGAVVGAGSGLSGLRDRVGTVDGTLQVRSPRGGPTEVTVELPMTPPGVEGTPGVAGRKGR